MLNKYATIIGSRDITDQEKELLEQISFNLIRKGYILRSGGDDGSDSVVNYFNNVEIIIPWDNFNGLYHDGKRIFSLKNLPDQIKAKERAMSIHPAPDRLSDGAKMLHTRNIYQVIGPQGAAGTKSNIVIYCADEGEDGHPKGGTRTAVVYAKQLEVPTHNIRIKGDIKWEDM